MVGIDYLKLLGLVNTTIEAQLKAEIRREMIEQSMVMEAHKTGLKEVEPDFWKENEPWTQN